MVRELERKRQKDLIDALIRLEKTGQNRIQKLQRIIQSKDEKLAMKDEQIQCLWEVIQSKDERIAELECLVNPYSPDGDAICNSD
ncbi:hypothetical protein [Nostoc sp. 106C]|uniref:hypothetical protein n=1 Tax=Nostoc sp. 106C TaxID=1932667 RepID=UPI000A3660AC|nr:hypothetical protein [Nostoc sp. 106C]OUL22162.1 hypothetical protein BV375_27570 [Nostoc sp. 106C]